MKKFRSYWFGDDFVSCQKLLRIMKLTILLVFAGLVTYASSTYSQATKLSMKLNQATILEVFNEIENQSEFNIAYNSSKIDVSKTVDINVENQTVDKILDKILKDQGLHYEIVDRYIVITDKAVNTVSTSGAQQKSVSGKVTNTVGEPIPGVTVVIRGTSNGIVTDNDGSYSLVIPENGKVLVFSFVGMLSQEIEIGNQSSINVELQEDIIGIEEVVAIGYGTQKRINLTGAVATIEAQDLQSRPITQTSQALQGKMAGVTVTQNFGMPGSDGGTIRIRGIGTLGGKDPLVLIDGVEGSINDINPNDIENMSVLKDAASASIYGSRAANGVILITTKRGGKNEAMKISYNGLVGSQIATDLPEKVSGIDYLIMKNENERNNGRTELYTQAYIDEYRQNVGKEPYFDTDWYGLAMKPSSLQHQHTLTVQGGTEKISSLVSLNYLNQDALIEDSGYKRTSIRFNTNFQASKILSFTMDGFLRRENTDHPNPPGGGSGNGLTELFRMMSELPATYPGIWADGTLGEGWNGDNPLGYIREGGDYNSVSSRVVLNLRGKLKFTDWLNLEAGYAPKYITSNSVSTTKHYTFKRLDGSTGTRPNGLNGVGNSNSRSLENFYQALLNFNKSFGKHQTSALFGYETIDYRNDNFSASRQNFLLPQYEVLSAGDENFKDNSGSASEWALTSYFGRVNYAFDNKYLVEANLRYDGSSRFASDKRWGWFPSVSVGWRIIQEGFMQDIDFLSNLKVRASWGELGNQNIGNYPYLGVVSINQPYYFGKTVVQGAGQTVLPNRNVTWETTIVLNGGLDFGFFNNKLFGSLDIYKKNTVDILYKRDIPSIIGLEASEQNIAEVQNKGWDFQIGWQDKIRDFNYSVDLVLFDVKNKVIDLNGKPQYGRNVIFENEEYQAFYGYECLGIYRSQEDLDKYPALNTAVKMGDLIFKDISGPDGVPDGIIDPENDKKIIGSNIPRFNFGTTFSFAFKNFDASIFLQGVGKKDLYYLATSPAYGGTYYAHELNRFIPDDPSTYETADWTRIGGAAANREDNSYYLYDAAYLRCKNMIFGYTLPKSLLQKMNIANVRIYFTGQNLFTIDKLKINSLDPESPNSTTGTNFYPNVKTFAFGIDLKF